MSHPTWVRGLKQSSLGVLHVEVTSQPTWVRGLKLLNLVQLVCLLSRTLRGCVD